MTLSPHVNSQFSCFSNFCNFRSFRNFRHFQNLRFLRIAAVVAVAAAVTVFGAVAMGQEVREVIKLSPEIRAYGAEQSVSSNLPVRWMEPFLVEPVVVQEKHLRGAGRVLASADERLFLSPGESFYASSGIKEGIDEDAEDAEDEQEAAPFLQGREGAGMRIFRQVTALRDPKTQEILGYEAQYVGRASLVEPEQIPALGESAQNYRPAILRLMQVREEVRVGDSLLPEPQRLEYRNITPHSPPEPLEPNKPLEAQIVKIYAQENVRYGGQYQVVAINQGTSSGLDVGTVLSLWRPMRSAPAWQSGVLKSSLHGTEAAKWAETARKQKAPPAAASFDFEGVQPSRGNPKTLKLPIPEQHNGTAIIFRTWERLSYALVLDSYSSVEIGHSLRAPEQVR